MSMSFRGRQNDGPVDTSLAAEISLAVSSRQAFDLHLLPTTSTITDFAHLVPQLDLPREPLYTPDLPVVIMDPNILLVLFEKEATQKLRITAVRLRKALGNRSNYATLSTLSSLCVRTGLRRMGHDKPLKILVADGNNVQCEMLVTYLMNLGYSPHVAKTTNQAASLVQRCRYDLVFIDLDLPSLIGTSYETKALVQMLKLLSRPETLIVALSEGGGQQMECLALGFDQFRCKPLSVAEAVSLCTSHSGSPPSHPRMDLASPMSLLN